MEESRLQPPQGVDPPYQVCKDVERNSYCPIDVRCVSPHSKEELDTWKKTDQPLLSTVESIQEAQIFMLLDFAPHMGYKGDFSGNKLQQGSLLQQLLSSPELGSQKVEHIMEEWALSGVAKCISNEPMDMVKQAVIHIDTYDPEVARGSVQSPGEGRSLTCSAALLDVMREYLMVALPKGSNRNPVVPLLELIDCTSLSALVVIMLLLLQCGDVERNPGPSERAEAVLEHFRKDFMKVMDANAVAYELCDKNCIDRGAMNRITKTTCDPAEQNQILHLALKDKCTDEAFLVACDIIIAVKGNPKMKALGENMKMLTGASPVVQAPLPSPTVTLNPEGAVDPVDVPTATRRAPSKRSPGGGDTFSSKRPRSCGGGTSSKADQNDLVDFAILTANERERLAVTDFLQLNDYPDLEYKEPRACNYSRDVFLKDKGAKLENLPDGPNYQVFTITVGKHRRVGVHFHCEFMGPWGAQDKTFKLLREAKEQKWPLRWIFVVGCCGASISEGKKEDYPRGTILVAEQIQDYLFKGKLEPANTGQDVNPSAEPERTVQVQLDSQSYEFKGSARAVTMNTKWLDGLTGVKLSPHRGSDYGNVDAKRVPYLSGPLVIKDAVFSAKFRGADVAAAGVEMEAVGVINAVNAIHAYENTPEEKRPTVILAKGISDYTGGKGEEASCMLFGKETAICSEDDLQVYATMQSIALVIRFVAAKIQFI